MITVILRNATRKQLEEAYRYTAHHLHIPVGEVTDITAVAYVSAHFEQGVHLSWEGFVDLLEADAR
jgi:hypothetical protein